MNKRIRKKLAQRKLAQISNDLTKEVLEECLVEIAKEMGVTVEKVKQMRWERKDHFFDAGYVFAPYLPLVTTKIETKEVVVQAEVVEVLPPSDDGSIQVGEGDGPAVLVPKVVETVTINPFEDLSKGRQGLLSRYAKTQVNPDLYKNISLTATP